MTSRERCLRAIKLERPDRMPVIPQAHIWTLYYYGSTSEACMENGSLYAELQLKGWRDFEWDGMFVATDSVALAHSLGAPVEVADTGVVPASGGLLENIQAAADLKFPDPRDTRLNEWIEATRVLVREAGDSALIIARADQGPFSLSCQLCGMQQFMTEIGYGGHHEDIHALLRLSTEYVWSFAKLLLEAGAHVVSIGDALASGSLISPATFQEYAFPYQQEVARRVHKHGGKLSIHICGQTSTVMNRLAETGTDVVEFDAPTDFREAWKLSHERVCLLGNVDTSDVMAFGTPEMVVTECRKRIDIVKPDGGFILSSGCALSPNTPAENIRAMVDAAKEFGVY
ncbi:MAG: uroporphyrinogen decarboxylase family protein [Ignavibacteriales bacterium]|nr:uroporphyrinogen decarboxylase family protein [Ignavibacteriales bacterium]